MKKIFRKSLATLMVVCMLIQLGGVSNAVGDEGYTEIIVGCGVDCEKAQLIVDLINGENSTYQTIAPTNILCLFGHSWAVGYATHIEHKYWQNPTRCRETFYRVDYCNRSGCNRMDLTQLTQGPIICCT